MPLWHKGMGESGFGIMYQISAILVSVHLLLTVQSPERSINVSIFYMSSLFGYTGRPQGTVKNCLCCQYSASVYFVFIGTKLGELWCSFCSALVFRGFQLEFQKVVSLSV